MGVTGQWVDARRGLHQGPTRHCPETSAPGASVAGRSSERKPGRPAARAHGAILSRTAWQIEMPGINVPCGPRIVRRINSSQRQQVDLQEHKSRHPTGKAMINDPRACEGLAAVPIAHWDPTRPRPVTDSPASFTSSEGCQHFPEAGAESNNRKLSESEEAVSSTMTQDQRQDEASGTADHRNFYVCTCLLHQPPAAHTQLISKAQATHMKSRPNQRRQHLNTHTHHRPSRANWHLPALHQPPHPTTSTHPT